MADNWQSKYIKRFNERLKQVTKQFTLNNDTATNPYIANYIRAINESGLAYTTKIDSKGNTIVSVRNTAENREKIGNLIDSENKYNPKTVGDIHAETRQKIERQRAATGDKRKISSAEVKRQAKLDIYYSNLDENLNILYNFYGVDVMSGEAKLPPQLQQIYKKLKKRKSEYKNEKDYIQERNKAVEDLHNAVAAFRQSERKRAIKNAHNWRE